MNKSTKSIKTVNVNDNDIVKSTKPVTKMSLARELFKEVTKEGYELQTEAKFVRGEFINRAMKEIDLTKHGAATYYYNLNRESKGLSLYGDKKAPVIVKERQTKKKEVENNLAAMTNLVVAK